jgi:hypothetical protein
MTSSGTLAIGDFDGELGSGRGCGGEAQHPGGRHAARCTFYGSASGLSASRDALWYQGAGGILDVAEENDRFGYALASGDFDGDGYADLAIGDWEDLGPLAWTLADSKLYGSASGWPPVTRHFQGYRHSGK